MFVLLLLLLITAKIKSHNYHIIHQLKILSVSVKLKTKS